MKHLVILAYGAGILAFTTLIIGTLTIVCVWVMDAISDAHTWYWRIAMLSPALLAFMYFMGDSFKKFIDRNR